MADVEEYLNTEIFTLITQGFDPPLTPKLVGYRNEVRILYDDPELKEPIKFKRSRNSNTSLSSSMISGYVEKVPESVVEDPTKASYWLTEKDRTYEVMDSLDAYYGLFRKVYPFILESWVLYTSNQSHKIDWEKLQKIADHEYMTKVSPSLPKPSSGSIHWPYIFMQLAGYLPLDHNDPGESVCRFDLTSTVYTNVYQRIKAEFNNKELIIIPSTVSENILQALFEVEVMSKLVSLATYYLLNSLKT